MSVAKPAGYSGTPLPKKLGIKEGMTVALIGAPPAFERTLGPMPAGVALTRSVRARAALTLWFITRRAAYEGRVRAMTARSEASGLWIIWPKQTSALAGDVNENVVRNAALAAGMVDFKVCAVDATWSGLRFSRRKPA